MPQDPKIISTFQQRRQLEEAIQQLAQVASQAGQQALVKELAANYPPAMLLTAVQHHLGDPSAQLRGGLGELCALLPRQDAINALRSAAGNRQLTPHARTAAALILERYLEAPPPQGLLADLAGNEDVPYQSLLEAVEAARQNRHVLLEYVTQMQQHGMEVAFMVLGLIDRLNIGDRIDLLRLIAQDLRPPVARAALDRLGQLAADDQGRPALRALYTLHPLLAPDYAAVVERMLRKLQFTGKRYTPPVPDRWRALVTPADVGSYISVWLVRDPAPMQPATGAALGFAVNLQEGFVQFSGAEGVARNELPAPRPIGEPAALPSGSRALLLEAPFDVGRWLVQQGLTAHWNRQTPEPLPDELRLYGDLVMEFASPQLPPELAALWATPAAPEDAAPDYPALQAAAALLVAHPAFQGWIQWSAAVWVSIQSPAETDQNAPKAALIGIVLREIGHLPARVQLLHSMRFALRLMALWLAIANAPAGAQAAVLTAAWLERLPVTENPFLQALLAAGLEAKGD